MIRTTISCEHISKCRYLDYNQWRKPQTFTPLTHYQIIPTFDQFVADNPRKTRGKRRNCSKASQRILSVVRAVLKLISSGSRRPNLALKAKSTEVTEIHSLLSYLNICKRNSRSIRSGGAEKEVIIACSEPISRVKAASMLVAHIANAWKTSHANSAALFYLLSFLPRTNAMSMVTCESATF